MIEQLTPEQITAIRSFWRKARTKGWRYGREAKGKEGNIIVITMIEPGGSKHWLEISPGGDIAFARTRMTCF